MTDARRRIETIRLHLSAISRGGAPTSDSVAVWLRELEAIPEQILDERIRQARSEHADRVEVGKGWGHITPDDVLRVHKRALRISASTGSEAPHNPGCGHRCSSGRVSVRDPQGYDYCVRCSCFAGNFWREAEIFANQRDVEDFLSRPGWDYALPPAPKISESHQRWISSRSEQVGPAQAAQDYWRERRRREAERG